MTTYKPSSRCQAKDPNTCRFHGSLYQMDAAISSKNMAAFNSAFLQAREAADTHDQAYTATTDVLQRLHILNPYEDRKPSHAQAVKRYQDIEDLKRRMNKAAAEAHLESGAKDPKTAKRVLHDLALDGNMQTRINVAGNPNAHQNTLRKLAGDPTRGVALAVARSGSSDSKTFAKLLKRNDREITHAVARAVVRNRLLSWDLVKELNKRALTDPQLADIMKEDPSNK